MNKNTTWLLRYLLVIVVTLILGASLGELNFFQKTSLGALKLTAANLVRFMGYGSALVLLWLLARRAAQELKSLGNWPTQASFFVLPLATVIIVPAAQPVLLLLLGGLLGPDLRKIYDWLFIFGTLGAAIWLVLALYQHLESLLESLRDKPQAPTAG
jgi:hypothetical protein